MNTTPRTRLTVLAAAALGLTATVGLATPAAAADGAPALGAVEDSLVHVLTTYSGYVAYPTEEGGWEWSDQVSVSATCTGWFASAEGHIATAGHCVDPDSSIREALISSFLEDVGAEELLDEAVASWTVEGYEDGSDVDRVVEVVQPDGVEDAVLDELTVAQVVDFESFEDGDAALLKVAGVTDATPLALSGGEAEVGDTITSIGFPASVQNVVDSQRLSASFKTGTVSSRQVTDGGVPIIEINAQVSAGMSGGPTVDETGAVVGINSFGITGESQSFNFVTDTDGLASFLEQHGVDPIVGSDDSVTGTALEAGSGSDAEGTAAVSGDDAAVPAADTADRAETGTSRTDTQGSETGSATVLIALLSGLLALGTAGVATLLVLFRRNLRRTAQQPAAATASAWAAPQAEEIRTSPAAPVR
ncbi:Trypsin-like peptidase domain-containing protein [Rathayibacter oskolensis]|uniref:Trypsin-like peptidase domain-containing protein n=1 Tax=Rathayibacter oskolensis TaxID=1891671 RepID=A0A1X7NYA5_9MICO|nr:serine protease [Rathayibacter oskolensis]SMH42517.1 Trypsin-like peptidase domain-containing protein [Rathayibacter oskolensis]